MKKLKLSVFAIFTIASIFLANCSGLDNLFNGNLNTAQNSNQGTQTGSQLLIISAPWIGNSSVSTLGAKYSLTASRNYQVSAYELGQTAQDAAIFESEIYVLHSGDNTLKVLDQATLEIKRDFNLGAGKNVYEIAFLNSTKAYVTNYLSQSVSAINPQTGQEIQNIKMPTGNNLMPDNTPSDTVAAPQSLEVMGSKVYVALTNLNSSYTPGGPGLLAIINTDTDTIEQIVTLNFRNPQSVYKHSDFPNLLFVVGTGSYSADDGGIDIIDSQTNTIKASIPTGGSPIRITILSNGKGFVTDATYGAGVSIIGFDANNYTKGSVYTLSSSGWASDITCDKFDNIYITDGTNSKLYIINETGQLLEEPYDISLSPSKVLVQE